MPETNNGPADNDVDQIRFRVSKQVAKDIHRFAREHGLTVSTYVAMMINLHVNGVRRDEAARAAKVSSHDRG